MVRYANACPQWASWPAHGLCQVTGRALICSAHHHVVGPRYHPLALSSHVLTLCNMYVLRDCDMLRHFGCSSVFIFDATFNTATVLESWYPLAKSQSICSASLKCLPIMQNGNDLQRHYNNSLQCISRGAICGSNFYCIICFQCTMLV